jgi:hypothetical protein
MILNATLAPKIHAKVPSKKYSPMNTITTFRLNNMISGKNLTTTNTIAHNPINSNILLPPIA